MLRRSRIAPCRPISFSPPQTLSAASLGSAIMGRATQLIPGTFARRCRGFIIREARKGATGALPPDRNNSTSSREDRLAACVLDILGPNILDRGHDTGGHR